MKNSIEVNDENFEKEVIEQSKNLPVLADFFAGWCPPCMMLKPILEKIAEESEGKFILAKVDTEESQNVCMKYNISGIPDVKLFKDGKVIAEFRGAMPESQVKDWLEKHLN